MSPDELRDTHNDNLDWTIRRNQQPGAHTYSACCCDNHEGGRHARGGGVCLDCAVSELMRRELSE